MPLRFALLLLAALLAAPSASSQDEPRPDYLRVPVDVSVWHRVSLGHAIARGDTTRPILHHLSLNLPLGTAGRLEGVALGVFGSAYTEDVVGAQLSGLGNVAGGSVRGLQAAGLGNVAGDRLAGLQIAGLGNVAGDGGGILQAAGFGNVAGGGFGGIQASGFGNVIGGEGRGLQTGGFGNIVGDGYGGLQVAGFGNIVGNGLGGLQAAGFGNIVGDGVVGIQVAGLGNIAGEDLAGLQVAGLGNIVGGTLRGLQVGAVNIAAASAGVQVGLVNVAGEQRGIPVGLYSRSGGVPVHADVWADETGALLASLRSGSAIVTNYFGVGVRPFTGGPFRWDVHAGLGVVQPLGERMEWGVEAFAHALFAEDFSGGWQGGLYRLRVPLAYELRPTLRVVGGPSLSVLVSDRGGLAPYAVVEREGAPWVRGWAGGFLGLRFRLTEG
jgi:hypothetical protein